jgi:alpha-N-arabinofuranosidase
MADLRRRNGRDEPWPIRFWGVGNENWGCGGQMRPGYYADLYRQYASFCRNLTPGQKLYKVACGLTDEWNDVLMREAGRFMDGLSVHYYTVPGSWDKKGSSTDFDESDWTLTLQKAANIDVFLKQTSAIMDRHDPARRVGIVMDEWGTWFDVEPGTNPGFLYQQNTIRDALVAGLTLNIFHAHAKRLHVANIAQTVNVLQAMILTDNQRMLCTPTYHVFEMYKVHQDATLLPTTLASEAYVPTRPLIGTAGAVNPTANTLVATDQISASASRDAAGTIHVSLCNLHHDRPAELGIDLRGATAGRATGRVLTAGAMNAMNTFDAPDAVKPQPFDAFKLDKTGLHVTLPARAVVVMALT